MAERLRAEAADLDVVLHQRQRLAALVGRRREELPLMIEARAPRQHAADIEPLAFDLPEHVRRIHAFGRRRVVRAAGRVDVMVAAVEAARRRIDPALEPHGDFRAEDRPSCPPARRGNRHGALDPPILGPAAVEHRELAGRQQHVLAVRTIDVLLEKQIRRQPLRLRREHVTLLVHELKPAPSSACRRGRARWSFTATAGLT